MKWNPLIWNWWLVRQERLAMHATSSEALLLPSCGSLDESGSRRSVGSEIAFISLHCLSHVITISKIILYRTSRSRCTVFFFKYEVSLTIFFARARRARIKLSGWPRTWKNYPALERYLFYHMLLHSDYLPRTYFIVCSASLEYM